uniref:Cytochrome c biogenesis F n=1 Tax=Pelargonium citronellum TaxID=73188 RepID=A0A1J0PJT4_9ROSI|nr:cytochrome c biogenesis F [Pelargonium citronellum]
MLQLQNFFFFITAMIVLSGTAAPILFKSFISRDVSIGAPFFNGTLIPILISVFALLVYLYSRQLLGTKAGSARVLVKTSRPILFPYIISRSSYKSRARQALFSFVLLLHFLFLEFKADFSYLESLAGVLCLLCFCTLFFLPREKLFKRADRAQLRKRRRVVCLPTKEGQLEVPALPTSPETLGFGHISYQRGKRHMNLSHGGVCIFVLGLVLSNTKKLEFTQGLSLGSELNMGKELCCLRGLDHLHGPTFHSICSNLMIYKGGAPILDHEAFLSMHSYETGKLEHFLHRWLGNKEDKEFLLSMFPEKRYFRESTSTTEVAIHTNLFTDLYAVLGTRIGGWYTTLIKLPFIFLIRIGFLLSFSGGIRGLLRDLKREKLRWN